MSAKLGSALVSRTKGEKMELAKHNIPGLRECSVMLWRCDFYGHEGGPQAEGGVSATPLESSALAASHAVDHVQEYTGMPMVVIKIERDAVDSITTEKPETQLEHLSENLVTDIGWPVKEGDDFIVKTEDKDGEAVVKQELNTGLVIKIERDAVYSFNTEKPEAQLERLSENLGDDFIVKTEDKDGEAVVKQELDIGLVIKIEHDGVDSFNTEKPEAQLERLSENLDDDFVMKTEDEDGEAMVKQKLKVELMQAFPDPRPGTSSGGSRAPSFLFTNFSQTNLRTEKEKYNERDSGVPSSASFMLNSKRANSVWKKLREPFHNRFEGESASTSCEVTKASTFIGNEQYGCHHCKYVTKKKRYLVNHVRIHMYEKLHKCERCEYSTPRLCHLKSHMCTHTGEKPYKCKQCGFSTTSQSVLKKHMNVHTGVKPHKCEQCDYSTARQGDLTIHKRIHTGEKPYKCEQCGYSTPWPGRLNKHMLIHTGEKPYKCKQCGYSTSQVGNLKSHIRIHTGEKPFKCKQCEYSASHLSSLKSHIRTHTGERRYKCDQCDYRASRLGRVKLHMRTHMD